MESVKTGIVTSSLSSCNVSADPSKLDCGSNLSNRETYTLASDEWAREWMRERTAVSHAGFLIPYLKSGMSILDCGCGPASITRDFAVLVSPGFAVGLDIQYEQIRSAVAFGASYPNLMLAVADCYTLPFSTATFDAVYSHSLAVHLSAPALAIDEMRRVVRRGGFVGMSDPDYSRWSIDPPTPLLDRLRSLFTDVVKANGGSPFYARQQKSVFIKAGFKRTQAHDYSLCYTGKEQTALAAEITCRYLRSPLFVGTALSNGLATIDSMNQMEDELARWSSERDGSYVLPFCATIGWA